MSQRLVLSRQVTFLGSFEVIVPASGRGIALMDIPALMPLSVLLGIVAQLLIKSCWGICQSTTSPGAGTPNIQGRQPDLRNRGTPTRRSQMLFILNLWMLFHVFIRRVEISFHHLGEGTRLPQLSFLGYLVLSVKLSLVHGNLFTFLQCIVHLCGEERWMLLIETSH